MDPEKSRLEEQPLLPAADVNHGQHVDFQGERVVPNKRRFRFLGAWLALLLLWNFSGGLFAPLHRGRGHEKSPTRTITNFPDVRISTPRLVNISTSNAENYRSFLVKSFNGSRATSMLPLRYYVHASLYQWTTIAHFPPQRRIPKSK